MGDILSQKENVIVEKLLCTGADSEELHRQARIRRRQLVGDRVFVRGSLEYSNVCTNNCSFCGMAKSNQNLQRYRLSFDEMTKSINLLKDMRVSQLHLVGGEDKDINIDTIGKIVSYATDRNIAVTLVLGELKPDDYIYLYKAGARRYILKFETSNAETYSNLKGRKNLIERLAHLFYLREIGYKIGTGIIAGLPTTSLRDLARDLLLLQRLAPDMASVSVFSPNGESALKDEPPGSKDMALNFLSLMRLSLEYTPIITCSSSFGPNGQIEALQAGANLMSVHITPYPFSDKFSMYTSVNRTLTQYNYIQLCSEKVGLKVAEYV
nr:radical SAM protein [Fumia xinanensis]